MSRQELAEAVNAYLWTKYRRQVALDENYVGKLEVGKHRWPQSLYREAFRAVLQVASDGEIGFYIIRRTRSSKSDAIEAEHQVAATWELPGEIRDPRQEANTVNGDLLHAHDFRFRPIFVQYLNPEVLACYNAYVRHDDNRPILDWAIRVTRVACLLTDSHLLIPASYVFEVPHFSAFLDATRPLLDADALRYVAPIPDPEAYRDSKVVEYREDPSNPYVSNASSFRRWGSSFQGVTRRMTTAAADIGEEWTKSVAPGGDLFAIRQSLLRRWQGRPSGFERIIEETPERLEGRAFVGRFVRRVLPVNLTTSESHRLDLFLSRTYLQSYVRDLDANLLIDFDSYVLSCGLQETDPGFATRLISTKALGAILRFCRIYRFVVQIAGWDELLTLKESPEFGLLSLYAYKPADVYRVRIAAIRAYRRHEYGRADSLAVAVSNVRLVVAELLDTLTVGAISGGSHM